MPVFDLKGKHLGDHYISLKEKNPVKLYPLAVYKGSVYQVAENLDEETWELNRYPL